MEKKNDMSMVIRYVWFTVSCIILGAGIALCDHAMFGTDSFSVFVKGLSITAHISMSLSNALLCGAQILFAWFMDRKDVTWATVISLFASSLGIWLFDSFLPVNGSMTVRVVLLAAGIVVYTFGVAMSQYPKCGYTTYDCFIFSLQRIFHTEHYHTLRWAADGGNLLMGWLLGGRVGICTILLLIGTGKMVEIWLRGAQAKFGLVEYI